MKTLTVALASTFTLLALASGCAVGTLEEEDEVAQADQALCENKDGVNSAMTALAVAAGQEMRRWLPYRDFQWNYSTGKLELSQHAAPRCPNRVCTNTLAVLAMQDAPANTVKFPGNIVLNSTKLKAALNTNWHEQASCYSSGSCQQEPWDLGYTNWEYGSCDVKYFYNVFEQGSSTRITDPAQLNKLADNLIFLGYPENKMLNFYVRNGQVSVDPTGGLNEGGTTTSGSCTVACSKFSTTNIKDQCCSCNGLKKKYVRSTFSTYMYLCQ